MELHFIDIYIKYNGQNIATVVLLFMSGAICVKNQVAWWQIPCTYFSWDLIFVPH